MRFESIASGSSGNCIYVGSDRTHLLMDVGISRKRTGQALHDIGLDFKDIDGIFLTHEHSDHIMGLPVIAKYSQMPIYATKGTIRALAGMPKYRDIDPDRFICIRADEPVSVGDLKIDPMAISHDAAEPVGYRVYEGSKKACICTDLSAGLGYPSAGIQPRYQHAAGRTLSLFPQAAHPGKPRPSVKCRERAAAQPGAQQPSEGNFPGTSE